MQPFLPLVLGLLMADPAAPAAPFAASPEADNCAAEMELGNLRELLQDREDPRGQSQAALLLVQSRDTGAEKIVRQNLLQPENEEAFLALAAAVRLRQDRRFLDELLAALTANRPRIRQVVAETLAVLADHGLVKRLENLAKDGKWDIRIRQTALWTLGRCGRQEAAGVLVEVLSSDGEDLRHVAAGALTDLTGQNYGTDPVRWKAWWARHKDLSTEQWLSMRLSFQTSRTLRLEGELARTRAQVLRLHQQVYVRLPVGERFVHLQELFDQEDPAVRVLAVVWGLELLPAADAPRHEFLAKMLLRLSHDSSPDVQRAAVLALGRLDDSAAFERLQELLATGTAPVRAASARSLAQQARSASPAARARQKDVIAALQKALDDRVLEVVVEAAESLGILGAPEAGPVLTGLLRHPSEHVRKTAAQALERMADASLTDGLLRGLDDPSVPVRFSLVGALGRASDGKPMSTEQRKRMLTRLEWLLKHDGDAGVRSRAATVIGERAGPESLEMLWRVVLGAPAGRVQDKTWDAFLEILTRSGDVKLLHQWDSQIVSAGHSSRRVQMLARVYARWDQRADLKDPAARALEALVQAQIDLGKWSAAVPLIQNVLARNSTGDEAIRTRCLNWLLAAGEMAMKDGNRDEVLRIVQVARAYLASADKLAEAFTKLENQATRKE
jgi:HEAT repeat protein